MVQLKLKVSTKTRVRILTPVKSINLVILHGKHSFDVRWKRKNEFKGIPN